MSRQFVRKSSVIRELKALGFGCDGVKDGIDGTNRRYEIWTHHKTGEIISLPDTAAARQVYGREGFGELCRSDEVEEILAKARLIAGSA